MTQIIYTDDADAFLSWTVTDTEGSNLDWADPMIAVDGGAYASASWQGTAASTREIRLAAPLGLGFAAGRYGAYLKVPNGNDIKLGAFLIVER